ncbi:hypothetical protein BLNAU_21533 [Blattamonas nauphoetae]|uniref:Protein kinase domain-containing protein n=1 Tax=Blattamonas nauphoetae TaxID=2049346 RepID=A0ABQ9WVM3_9EUKA|nr:hypothetical protein BLNAU_21533 [Blattamonas nauphoetae]
MNAGSSLLCSNSSFTSCSDTATSVQHFSVTQDISTVIGTSVFHCCTFKSIVGTDQGAINQETANDTESRLEISWCNFQACSTTKIHSWTGVVRQFGISNIFYITDSGFSKCSVAHGGTVCLPYGASQTIYRCTFVNNEAHVHAAAVFSRGWDAQSTTSCYSNVSCHNCVQTGSDSNYGAGAILLHKPITYNMEYMQFRDCSAVTNIGADIQIDYDNENLGTLNYCDSTSTGNQLTYTRPQNSVTHTPISYPSSTKTIISRQGQAINHNTVLVTMKLDHPATGYLLTLVDNAASGRTQPDGYAPNIARFLPFKFEGTDTGLCTVEVGESRFAQLHLDEYLVTAASFTDTKVTIPPNFNLPAVPTLIAASCGLDEFEQNAVVALKLRTESLGKHTVTLNTVPEVWFEIEFKDGKDGVSEPAFVSIVGNDKKLTPETEYEIKSLVRSDGLIVIHPEPIKFTVPKRSCLTTLDPLQVYSNLDKQVSVGLEGYKLVGEYKIGFSVNSSVGVKFEGTVVFGSDGKGTMVGVLFDSDWTKVDLKYNTRYEVVRLTKSGFEQDFVTGLCFTTMKEPTRLLGVGVPVDKNDRNSTTISLLGHAAVTGQYKLDLENSADSTDKVTVDATFTGVDAGEAHATLYPTRQLKYGVTYKVTGMVGTMSTPPKIHVEAGLTLTIGQEPPRLTVMSAASSEDKQKKVSMALTGIKMTNGPFTISLNGSKTIKATFAADGVSGSSTAILFSTTASEVEVEYGQTYNVLGVTDKDSQPVLFHAGLSFATPSEPTRLVSLSIVEYDSLKKNVLVTMNGRELTISSKYEVDLSRTSSCECTLTMEWNSSLSRWEGSASLFPTATADLVFGETYSIVEFRVQSISTPLFFEPNSIDIIPEPPRLISIDSADDDILTTTTLTLNTTQLVAGTVYRLTLTETPRSSSNTATTSEVWIDVTASDTGVMSTTLTLYPFSEAVLKYSQSYSVVSVAAKTRSNPILIETADCVFVTPSEPTRIENGSATLNSQGDTATIVVAGRELKVGTYFIVIESGEKSFSTTVTTTTKGELKFDAPTESSSSPSHVQFGVVYTFKTVKLDGLDVFVNLDASVEIPVPPKMSGVSVSPNTIGTGLWIGVEGSDLPVGKTFTLTISSDESSFSFAVSFSTPKKGSTEQQRLGWSDSLQYNTTYKVDSLRNADDDTDRIVIPSALTLTTPKKPVDFVIFSSTESGDSSQLCGERTSSCSSMDRVWEVVEGIGFARVSVRIVDATGLWGGIRVSNGMVVLVQNGSNKEPRLDVGSLSGTESQPGVVTVVEASLELKDVDVVLSSGSASFVFLHSTSSSIVMKEGSVLGSQTGWKMESGLCSWETGVIVLVDSDSTVKSTVFSGLPQGAIQMKGGQLSVEGSIFHDNTPWNVEFESVRHNIHCSDSGKVSIGSVGGGDGSSDIRRHSWIGAEECSVEGEGVKEESPFFIPSLDVSKSEVKLNKEKTKYSFDLVGTTLIPCGLFLEVFEKSGKNGANGPFVRELTQSTTESFSETNIKVEVVVKEISLSISAESEWHARLLFGQGAHTDSFQVKRSAADDRKAQTRKTMSWLIPVICASVALLLFIIILVVLLRRRRQKNDTAANTSKHEELDALPLDKIEDIVDYSLPNSSIVAVPDTDAQFEEHSKTQANPTKGEDPNKYPLVRGGVGPNDVEGVKADAGVQVVKINRRDTLYNRLHGDGKAIVNKKAVAQNIAHALAQLHSVNADVTLLDRLSSHFVIFGDNDEIQLDLKGSKDVNEIDLINGQQMIPAATAHPSNNPHFSAENRDPQTTSSANTNQSALASTNGGGFELLRWRAPEAGGKAGEGTQAIDHSKAAVFSLGLILFEIETETMHFGETDAMNAFRQLKAGVLPKMELVQDANLRELIVECLSIEPAKRPNLDGIEKRLEWISFSGQVHNMNDVLC